MKNVLAGLALTVSLAACVAVPLAPNSLLAKTQFADENVGVTEINESKLPDNTLKLAIYGRSLARFDKVVRHRVRWYDASNTPISTTVANWSEQSVTSQTPFEFTAIGPGPRAVRYVVEFETK